jgi:hypothetical protein
MTTTLGMINDDEASADTVGDACDVEELLGELNDAVEGAQLYIEQQRRNYDTRNALWEGQSDDQRMWDENVGTDNSFPFDGASDARVFYADGLIAERVRIVMAAFRRMHLQAVPLRGAGSDAAQNVTTLLTWLLRTQGLGATNRQVALLVNWVETFGYAVLAVGWREDIRVTMQPLNLDKMRAAAEAVAEQDGGQALAIVGVLVDPARDEQALALLRTLSPLLTKRGAGKVLRDLRKTGAAEVPQKETVGSLHWIEALRPYVDVFFPSRSDLQSEPPRWIARRQWLNEAEFRNLAAQHEWDEDWVEKVCQEGKGQTFDQTSRYNLMVRGGLDVERSWWMDSKEQEHLIEIIWHYRRGVHEDYQLPAMYLSVYCPAITDSYGYHGPAEDEQYPFFGFTREAMDKPTVESRGVAELADGWQRQLKTQRDAFINRAQQNSLPPLLISANAMMARTRLDTSPGSQHTVANKAEVRYLPLPNTASDAAVVTDQTEREADRYMGRISEHVPPTAQALATEDLVGGFLTQFVEPVKRILQLAQVYLPPTTIVRITGDQTQAIEMSKEDIRGMFEIQLTFDPDDLNTELSLKKLEVWKELLSLDTLGVVDRAELLRTFAKMLNRDMADRLVGTAQQASEKQVQMAKDAWTNIVSGVEPPMLAEGQNYNLQLQTMMGLLQNPMNMKRLQALPDAAALFQRYIKHLQFGASQQQNAETGLKGVEPLDMRTLGEPAQA